VPGGAVLQPGDVGYFAMSTAPTGWLKANGAAVSRTTYAALFAAIGVTFGVGNGSTTFNLPDLRGEFLRGWDDGRGVDSGRAFGSSQLDQMQTITGSFRIHGDNGTPVSGAFSNIQRDIDTNTWGAGSGDTDQINFTSANSPDARTGTETRPRNVALLACIKF
jgi:phage-related tail fiber protein